MKKILSFVALTLLTIQTISIAAETVSATTKQAINEYKKGNYTGCQQLLMKDVVENNSNDIYANYYFGLATWRAGNPGWAGTYFDKVLNLGAKGDLKYYAENARNCVWNYEDCKAGKVEFVYPEPPAGPQSRTVTKQVVKYVKKDPPKDELDLFIGDDHAQYFKNVNSDIEQKHLEVLKYEINTGRPVDSSTFQQYKNYSNKKKSDASESKTLSKEDMTAENINKMLEAKNFEIENGYNNLQFTMAQNKRNIKNR